jgi:hypothetical protein
MLGSDLEAVESQRSSFKKAMAIVSSNAWSQWPKPRARSNSVQSAILSSHGAAAQPHGQWPLQ